MAEKFLIKSIAYIIAYSVYFKRQVVYYWKYVTTGQLTESIFLSIKRQRQKMIDAEIEGTLMAKKGDRHSLSYGFPCPPPPPPQEMKQPSFTVRQLEDFDKPVDLSGITGNYVAELGVNGLTVQNIREITETKSTKNQNHQR